MPDVCFFCQVSSHSLLQWQFGCPSLQANCGKVKISQHVKFLPFFRSTTQNKIACQVNHYILVLILKRAVFRERFWKHWNKGNRKATHELKAQRLEQSIFSNTWSWMPVCGLVVAIFWLWTQACPVSTMGSEQYEHYTKDRQAQWCDNQSTATTASDGHSITLGFTQYIFNSRQAHVIYRSATRTTSQKRVGESSRLCGHLCRPSTMPCSF